MVQHEEPSVEIAVWLTLFKVFEALEGNDTAKAEKGDLWVLFAEKDEWMSEREERRETKMSFHLMFT